MTKISSTQNTGNLVKFIQEIPSRGVPDKLTGKELASLGYTSSNDKTIIPVLKSLDILNSNGTPTESFQKLRDKSKAPSILGSCIKSAYSELYKLYPDAHKQSVDVLSNYFSQHSSAGAATIRNIVKTFNALCKIASFEDVTPTPTVQTQAPNLPQSRASAEVNLQPRRQGPKANFDQKIHFNIQVHIPGDQTPEVYESIFKNLGKYVLGINEGEE